MGVIMTHVATHMPAAAGYTGFETEGLFVGYPGVSTLDTGSPTWPAARTLAMRSRLILADPNRLYDPRLRPWYGAAKAKPGTPIVTEPYLDFHGRGWAS